jgi:hypothetical protein
MNLSLDVNLLLCIMAGLASLVVVEGLAIVTLSRSVRKVSRVSEKIAHLNSALVLLTDTTEAGMASIAAELERIGTLERSSTAVNRGATSRRIAAALLNGHSLEQIAASEALSESEVRLHMRLAADTGGFSAPLRG